MKISIFQVRCENGRNTQKSPVTAKNFPANSELRLYTSRKKQDLAQLSVVFMARGELKLANFTDLLKSLGWSFPAPG